MGLREWLGDMQRREAMLKDIVDLVAAVRGSGLRARSERTSLRLLLQARLASMRAEVERLVAATPPGRRDLLAYRIRILLPLYSHLASLAALAESGCLSLNR